MKQKNLILMVVAVGCGLVAALLTSQMSAKPKVETVDVIVAAKDLPVGTLITKDDLPRFIKYRALPKDALPPMFVQSEEELVGKRLSRAVRSDETFNPQDLKTGANVTLPKGMDMISIAVGLPEAVAGFVHPGSRVDILASTKVGNRQIAFPLLVDVLVVAVDANLELPKESANFGNLNTVSFAVTREQALLLQLARTRGCAMSLVLRHPDRVAEEKEVWSAADVRRILSNLNDNAGDDIIEGPKRSEQTAEAPPPAPTVETPKVETVALPVAKIDLPPGTQLTGDLIKESFEVKELPAPAPENAIKNLEELEGKFLQNGLAANQWLPKSFLSDFAPGKSAIKDEFEPEKPGPVEPQPVPVVNEPAKRVHNLSVVTSSGRRLYRYQEKTPNSEEWILMGEITRDGKLIPAQDYSAAPAAPSTPPQNMPPSNAPSVD